MSPQKRVSIARRRLTARVLREQGRLEEAAAAEQAELLQRMRRALLQVLGESSGFKLFHYSQLLQTIDREISRGRDEALRVAGRRVIGSFEMGSNLVEESLRSAGLRIGAGIPGQLLSATIDVTADRVRGVWSELGSRLKTNVRQAALGVQDPFTAIQNLSTRITNPKTFGTSEVRAESIIRTELGRTFTLANHQRMVEADKRIGGLRKYWLSAEDGRVRPTHEAAGQAYAPGGTIGPIPVGKPFIVGTARLMQPLDPSGPPEETINCRCVSVPYVEEAAALAVAA